MLRPHVGLIQVMLNVWDFTWCVRVQTSNKLLSIQDSVPVQTSCKLVNVHRLNGDYLV